MQTLDALHDAHLIARPVPRPAERLTFFQQPRVSQFHQSATARQFGLREAVQHERDELVRRTRAGAIPMSTVSSVRPLAQVAAHVGGGHHLRDSGCKYVIGWDIGSRNDFSVGVVLDLTKERIDVANYVRIKDDYAAGIDVPKLERLKNATRHPGNVRSSRVFPSGLYPPTEDIQRFNATRMSPPNVHLSRFPGGRTEPSKPGSSRAIAKLVALPTQPFSAQRIRSSSVEATSRTPKRGPDTQARQRGHGRRGDTEAPSFVKARASGLKVQ